MVIYLDGLTECQAKALARTDSIAYIPLIKLHKIWQWGHLNSGKQQRREVAIADIVREQRVYSFIDFQ